jgi:hypothetical protein
VNDSRELLDKADALLERYRGDPMQLDDTDYPVLTDAVLPGAARSGEPPHVEPASQAESADSSVLAEEEVRRLEQDIIEQLERSLGPLMRSALAEPLRARIEEHLREAMTSLNARLRDDLEALAHDAVARALEQALAELRTSPPKRDGS